VNAVIFFYFAIYFKFGLFGKTKNYFTSIKFYNNGEVNVLYIGNSKWLAKTHCRLSKQKDKKEGVFYIFTADAFGEIINCKEAI
jgi:hypothetical protein